MLADIEAGLVGTVIVKDMSRLGRNYLQVGMYTEMIFPQKNVRFIAINDGVDSAQGDNDFAPLRNIFKASIFSGMVFCDTCNRRISFVPERAEKIYVGSCMEYRKIGRQGCTPHRIYERDLHDAVLKDIREWAKLALKDEKAVLDKVMEHENKNKTDAGTVIEKKFSLEKRLGEVEKVIAKLYEDYALGKAGADEVDLLLPKYRKEQGELKAQLALFEEENSERRETAQNAEKWVALIRQYNDLQELTAGIIRELITKIYVGDVRKVDGEKVQSIEIHYRFIGSLSNGAGK